MQTSICAAKAAVSAPPWVVFCEVSGGKLHRREERGRGKSRSKSPHICLMPLLERTRSHLNNLCLSRAIGGPTQSHDEKNGSAEDFVAANEEDQFLQHKHLLHNF